MNSNLIICDTKLIDISGLCEPSDVTNVISEYPYWIQMNIPEKLTIPNEKPDIEQINSVNVSVDIMRKEVVRVPMSPKTTTGQYIPNLEGKISTGRKLIIEGNLCQKVSYTANDCEQSIHSAHFYIPFSSYIVVPAEISFTNGVLVTTEDSLNIDFQVNSCIEDVTINMIDLRTILKQVTLLLYAIPNQSI